MANGRIFYHLFSEQSIYTKNLIESLLEELPNSIHYEIRLGKNGKDICELSIKYIGLENSKKLWILLKERINIIKNLTISAMKRIPADLDNSIREIFDNSSTLAKFLSNLDTSKLDHDDLNQILKAHNQYIIDMILANIGGEYLNSIKIFDEFHNEMINMSDMLSNSFSKLNHDTECGDWSLLFYIIVFVFIMVIFMYLIHKYYTFKLDTTITHPAFIRNSL